MRRSILTRVDDRAYRAILGAAVALTLAASAGCDDSTPPPAPRPTDAPQHSAASPSPGHDAPRAVVDPADTAAVADADPGDLIRRFRDDALSDGEIDAAIDRALEIQADPDAAWNPAWGEFVERAFGLHPPIDYYNRAVPGFDFDTTTQREAGYAEAEYARQLAELAGESDPTFVEYLGHVARPTVTARADLRRGDPLPIRFTVEPRASEPMATTAWAIRTVESVTLGDLPLLAGGMYGVGGGPPDSRYGGSLSNGLTFATTSEQLAPLPDGPATLRVVVRVDVYPEPKRKGMTPVAVSWATYDRVVTLHAADDPTVRLIPDESARPAVEAAVTVRKVDAVAYANGSYALMVSTTIDHPPVPVGFAVFVRVGDDEIPAGTLYAPAGETSAAGTNARRRLPDGTESVDVVYRPDPAAAAGSLDGTEIWDGEVVVTGVPVTWEHRE